jgi:rubrerythrin
MELSTNLERRLKDVFEASSQGSKDNHPLNYASGNWFCPGCGLHLEKASDGAYRCPLCNRTIGQFVYEIVEFHPHGVPIGNAEPVQ